MPFPITLDEIERAYAETGLRSINYEWLDYDDDGRPNCGCPLGVILVARGLVESLNDPRPHCAVARVLGLSRGQITAFLAGFGGFGGDYVLDLDAYAVGRAARKRFLPSEEG